MAKRRHWLVKSEPEVYPLSKLREDGATRWEGIRNYQARNSLREMQVGDLVLFYHSNAEPPAVVGIARVSRGPAPDLTALDPRSEFHDPKATAEDPRWSQVELSFLEELQLPVPLDVLRSDPELQGLEVARKGSRLSVTPVSAPHFARVVALGKRRGPTRSRRT